MGVAKTYSKLQRYIELTLCSRKGGVLSHTHSSARLLQEGLSHTHSSTSTSAPVSQQPRPLFSMSAGPQPHPLFTTSAPGRGSSATPILQHVCSTATPTLQHVCFRKDSATSTLQLARLLQEGGGESIATVHSLLHLIHHPMLSTLICKETIYCSACVLSGSGSGLKEAAITLLAHTSQHDTGSSPGLALLGSKYSISHFRLHTVEFSRYDRTSFTS